MRKVCQKQILTCRNSCCFGLCIQFYDVLESDIYRTNQDRPATGIQMVIFIELVQYAKNLGGKSQKNLVEHQIIKNDKKI